MILAYVSVFDKDENGYITGKELKRVMLGLGENLSEQDVDEMVRQADTDGDGRISFDGV